ncbi:hypothetical protein LTR10_007618 [Elasticomyces elasticus]|nr:hypothetical protein LTR10_007618 [Elasticomyces elasticus]
MPGKDVTRPSPTVALTTYTYTGVYCDATACFTSTTTQTKQYVVQTISEYVIAIHPTVRSGRRRRWRRR